MFVEAQQGSLTGSCRSSETSSREGEHSFRRIFIVQPSLQTQIPMESKFKFEH